MLVRHSSFARLPCRSEALARRLVRKRRHRFCDHRRRQHHRVAVAAARRDMLRSAHAINMRSGRSRIRASIIANRHGEEVVVCCCVRRELVRRAYSLSLPTWQPSAHAPQRRRLGLKPDDALRLARCARFGVCVCVCLWLAVKREHALALARAIQKRKVLYIMQRNRYI